MFGPSICLYVLVAYVILNNMQNAWTADLQEDFDKLGLHIFVRPTLVQNIILMWFFHNMDAYEPTNQAPGATGGLSWTCEVWRCLGGTLLSFLAAPGRLLPSEDVWIYRLATGQQVIEDPWAMSRQLTCRSTSIITRMLSPSSTIVLGSSLTWKLPERNRPNQNCAWFAVTESGL